MCILFGLRLNITSRHSFLYTLLKRKALPVAPVKRVEISSDLLVRMVSQLAQEKRRVPPMWSKKMRPIVKSLGVTELRLKCETKTRANIYCWKDYKQYIDSNIYTIMVGQHYNVHCKVYSNVYCNKNLSTLKDFTILFITW